MDRLVLGTKCLRCIPRFLPAVWRKVSSPKKGRFKTVEMILPGIPFDSWMPGNSTLGGCTPTTHYRTSNKSLSYIRPHKPQTKRESWHCSRADIFLCNLSLLLFVLTQSGCQLIRLFGSQLNSPHCVKSQAHLLHIAAQKINVQI